MVEPKFFLNVLNDRNVLILLRYIGARENLSFIKDFVKLSFCE